MLLLDAAGFDRVLVETVGAGQAEIEIASVADTVVVVEAPGLGDEVQAIKAGLLEIADIFAVNKADRKGAARTVAALEMMLETGSAAAQTNLSPRAAHGDGCGGFRKRRRGGMVDSGLGDGCGQRGRRGSAAGCA